ncbi:hypothetical protein NXV73_14755 [Bacteroides salyersiae]|nr:hypothetical protein [Bacteroides salyersiae]
MIAPVMGAQPEERQDGKEPRVSQNIRCQRHNRVFGQLPVPLSQQGTDTVCQAWAYLAFRHGGTQKVDAAAVCPGF